MRISHVLAKMLNDVESNEEMRIDREQEYLLSLEIQDAQKEMEDNTSTADEISSAVNDVEIARDVVNAGLQSGVDIATAKVLMSNLKNAIGKLETTSLDKEFAGLQSDNPKVLLAAGLQAADSILSKAKEALLKIWENILKGFKWFISKLKEMILAIFSPFKKILKRQRNNKFTIITIKEAEEFLNKNKAELESDDQETITKLKNNFIKTLEEKKALSYGINKEEAQKELEDFIASSGFLEDNAKFVNFMMNIFIVKKKIDDTLHIRTGGGDTKFFLNINRSIYEFSIIEAIAENKNSENISKFLSDNGVDTIAYIDRDLSSSDRMEKAFEAAVNKKFNDISKTGLSAIVAGDAVKYIDKIPVLVDKVIAVYKDIENTLEKIVAAGDEEDIKISDLNLKSDSFVYKNSSEAPLSMSRLISIDYVNIFSTGSISIRNQPTKVDLTLDQIATGIGNENEIVSGADIYKKIKTSMDRLEDSYEKILKEVDNTLKKKDFNPRSKNQRVVQFLVSNLGKLSPMKGVEYFGNISTSYKGILDVFNIKELVDEEFENLMRYGKDR